MQNKIKKIIFFYLLLLLLPDFVLAAPNIIGTDGIISNDSAIAINGNNFGASGPVIKVFDNFESGANTAYINSDIFGVQSDAVIGEWDACASSETSCEIYRSTYSTNYAKSGTKSARQNWVTDTQEGARWLGQNWGSSETSIYLSFWTYLPSGMSTPDGNIGLPNWKLYWFYETPYPTNDYSSETIYDPPSGGMSFGCVNDCYTNRIGQDFTPMSFIPGTWQRFEIYLLASATSGLAQEWITNITHARSQEVNLAGKTISSGTTGWDTFHIPGYARTDTTTNTYYDDVYVATGPGAQARVEIGNNSTYSACTELAILTPTQWNDNSITATVREGAFNENDSAYLYVIDSTGVANADGFPITFGESGSGDMTAPSSPSGLGVL